MLSSCKYAAGGSKPCKASVKRVLKAAKKYPSAKALVKTAEYAKAETKAAEKAKTFKTLKKMQKNALK